MIIILPFLLLIHKMTQRVSHLYIASSAINDRGVFTSQDIPKDSLLEICPVIVIPEEEMDLIKHSVLYNYYFDWAAENQGAIALGYGSIYNHSYTPNAEYREDYEGRQLMLYAIKDIAAGDEITINYNGDPEDQEPVWFDKSKNE